MVVNDDAGIQVDAVVFRSSRASSSLQQGLSTKCRNQIRQSQSLKLARRVARQENQGLAPE